MDNELSGKNAYQGHVVLDSNGLPALKLGDQVLYRCGIEDPAASQLFRLKQFPYIFKPGRFSQKARSLGRAIRLFMPRPDTFRNQAFRATFEKVLLVQHFHFQMQWECRRQPYDPRIEKRKPALDAMGHGHAVSL